MYMRTFGNEKTSLAVLTRTHTQTHTECSHMHTYDLETNLLRGAQRDVHDGVAAAAADMVNTKILQRLDPLAMPTSGGA